MSLPKGFKRLEYIQSSGVQYVDTLFKPNNNTRVTAEFEITESTVDWACVFGAREESLSRCFALFTNSNQPFYCNIGGRTDTHTFTTISPLGRHVADANKNAITINGINAVLTARTFQNTATTIYLCANNEDGAASMFCKMRIYSCQIYENGLLERDFVPAMLENGEVGLYDRVFHEFYRNAGTGEFIAGPEVQTVPKSPSNFRVEAATDTLVTLAWDPMEEVLGYRLYRRGQLLADTTEAFASVTVEPFSGAVFTVTAYNENGESAGTSLAHYSIPENPLLYLITDRTAQDVAERNPKGYYAASDLNRVGYAMNYVVERISEQGVQISVSPRTDWTDADWMAQGDAAAYLEYLSKIRNAVSVLSTTPAVPDDLTGFTFEEANNIELILLDIDQMLTYVYMNLLYAGEIFAGEV